MLALQINLVKLMTQRLTITGSTLRARPNELKADIARDLQKHAWPILTSGDIAPILDSEFPLAEAGAAHARMEASKHFGKIVLVT